MAAIDVPLVLEQGDRITAIDGQPIGNWFDMVDGISARPGQETALTVLRGERELELTLTPTPTEVDGKTYGRIGLYMPPYDNARLRYGPLRAVWESIDYNWRMTAIPDRR